MKIAMFLNAFPNISETFVLNQITGLIDRGLHVDICSMRPGMSEKVHADVVRYRLLERTRYLNTIPRNYIVRLGKAAALLANNYRHLDPAVLLKTLNVPKYGRAASSLSLLFESVPLLKERKYDVIHCQFGSLGPRTLQLKQIGAISGKLVVSFRGYDATEYLKKRPGVYDELFREADLFLAVSDSLRRLLIEAGCPKDKIGLHYSGIDCLKFTPVERTVRDGEPVKVITIARLVEKKGVAYALRAVAAALAAGRRVTYTIIGDGPLHGDLDRLIRELGIGRNVQMAGWKNHDEVIGLMRESHVLMAPSITTGDGDQEGIPNVIKEAMALGLPVISTMHSGIPELVENAVTGFLVPERDVDALTDRLVHVIDNPDMWADMGRNGRSYVEANYDINALNDRVVEIYRKLIGGDPSIRSHEPAAPAVGDARRIS